MPRNTFHAQRQHEPQLEDLVNIDDDWRGLTDAAARRRRQNRLNVRAHRRRKVMASSHGLKAASDAHSASVAVRPWLLHWVESRQALVLLPRAKARPEQGLLPMHVPASISIASAVFPLCSDHLITLVQFNVLRGSLANRQLVDAAMSVGPHTVPSVRPTDLHVFPNLTISARKALPQSLHPTEIQRTVAHPHWIDIIPHPRIRDNIISATGKFDEHLLWLDTVGGLFQGFTGEAGMKTEGALMWDTPWLWEGWELGESFAHKWAWILEDCDGALLATNYWREKRGEERLITEI